MENLYKQNGLVFWDEEDIMLRETFEKHLVHSIKDNLKVQNRAFEFFKCEATVLTPRTRINRNYTEDDVFMLGANVEEQQMAFHDWIQSVDQIEADKNRLGNLYDKTMELHNGLLNKSVVNIMDVIAVDEYMQIKEAFIGMYFNDELVLRPETTMGSYAYAKHLLNEHNERKVKPPLVVYQHGKSFRREQDQVAKNMRLKEFYQLEFQIIYSSTTKNDYSTSLIPAVRDAISSFIGSCRVEASDRLPEYAEWTQDVVCELTNMEVCSISKRLDFDGMVVLEVAIGTDRLIFNFHEKNSVREESKKEAKQNI
jgi:hypothetical protein